MKCTRDGGDGLSPPLSWENAPPQAEGYAVVMHHYPHGKYAGIDAPSHYWLLWDIPASVESLDHGNPDSIGYEGSDKDMRRIGYTPPCSQGTEKHTYVITVYAVDGTLNALPTDDDAAVDWQQMMDALRGHVVEAASISFVN